MGFWNDTCAISNLPIYMDDEVCLLQMEERCGIWFPQGLPQRATYAEYGNYHTVSGDPLALTDGDCVVAVRSDVWDAIVRSVREFYKDDSEPELIFQWAFGRKMHAFNESSADADLIRQCHCITLWTHQTRFSWSLTERHRGSQQTEHDLAGGLRRDVWEAFFRISEHLQERESYSFEAR